MRCNACGRRRRIMATSEATGRLQWEEGRTSRLILSMPALFMCPRTLRSSFLVGGAIGWGFGIGLGVAFRPWGWGVTRFDWGGHAVFIGGAPWGRTWYNRGGYAHPYGPGVRRWEPDRRAEGHQLIRRDEGERRAAREGHGRPEERHRGGRR